MKKYKKGDKVKYLDQPGVITRVEDKMGRTFYSVKFKNKSGGIRAVDSILSTDGSITELNEKVIFRNESLRLEIVEHSEPVIFQEAEYKGRKVKLNKPMAGDTAKFKVYVNTGKKNKDGTIKVKKVNFGQGGKAKGGTMRIRKNNPAARRSFRARHNCDNPGPKTKARYWSCRKW